MVWTRLLLVATYCLLGVGCQGSAPSSPAPSPAPSPSSTAGRALPPVIAEYTQFKGEPPTLLHLTSDTPSSVTVTALISRRQHNEVFTTKPPTHLTIRGVDYVPERTFFNANFPPSMTIDGTANVYAFSVVNESQARSEDAALVQALASGRSAQFTFASSMRGKGQSVVFDVTGFKKATGSNPTVQQRRASDDSDAASIRVVADGMKVPNQFGKTRSDLRVKANPKGRGKFVYVPSFKVAGHERWLLWFVLDGQAYALNGPAISISPELPRPLDRPTANWNATGSDVTAITQDGVNLIFRQ